MFYASLKSCPHLNNILKFIQTHKLNIMSNRKFSQHCICNKLLKTTVFVSNRNSFTQKKHVLTQNIRVHSTGSDQHRQKIVIETSTPKIEIERKQEAKSALKVLWSKLDPYIKLARWDKPIGVCLLYWPCAWSIALAAQSGCPPPPSSPSPLSAAALCLVGAGLMRGAGCTINDLWDRDIDRQVARTKARPLATGAVSTRQAVTFLAAQLSLALAVLLQFNWYTVLLGASSMLLVVSYPLAKRFTNYPQIFLGATFNWGALLGYSALHGTIEPAVCVPLYLGSLAWTVLYDTIYAHQDAADDARIGVRSTALTFGARPRQRRALAAWLCAALGAWGAAGLAAHLAAPYYGALAAAGGALAAQIYTLRPECPADCADKFKSNWLIGLVILVGILAGGQRGEGGDRGQRGEGGDRGQRGEGGHSQLSEGAGEL